MKNNKNADFFFCRIISQSRLLRWLLHSSQLQSLDSEETEAYLVYREVFYRIFSLLATGVLPASWLYYQHGAVLSAGLHAMAGLIFVIHAYLLLRHNVRVLAPSVLLAMNVGLYVSAFSVSAHGAMHAAFPAVVMFYLMLDRRRALLFTSIWVVVLIYLGVDFLSTTEAIVFIVSLLISSLFIELFSSLLHHHELALTSLAIRDPLTNAYNRRSMMGSLEQASAMFHRYGTPTVIVMIDIDHFKTVNDKFGHVEGDRVLANLVATLTERLRRTDRLCRYGGEEFVAILNGIELGQAAHLAESFCAQIRQTVLTEQQSLTISCGVAEVYPNESVHDWLHRCDTVLYRAKAMGRDRVEVDQAGYTKPVKD